MIENDFFKQIKEKHIHFSVNGTPINDCPLSSSGNSFRIFKWRPKLTIAHLLTFEAQDGIYIARYSIDESYIIVVQKGILVPGSDIITSQAIIDRVIAAYPELTIKVLDIDVINKWQSDLIKLNRRNIATALLYTLLTFMLTVGIFIAVEVYFV